MIVSSGKLRANCWSPIVYASVKDLQQIQGLTVHNLWSLICQKRLNYFVQIKVLSSEKRVF